MDTYPEPMWPSAQTPYFIQQDAQQKEYERKCQEEHKAENVRLNSLIINQDTDSRDLDKIQHWRWADQLPASKQEEVKVELARREVRRIERNRLERIATAEQKFMTDVSPRLFPIARNRLVAASEDQQAAIDSSSLWRSDDTKTFGILYGPNGTGKSLIASRLYWTRMEVNNFNDLDRFQYWSEADIVCQWRWAAGQKKKGWDSTLLRYARFLVIDDMGQHPHNDNSLELFYSILDYRYRFGLKTLITTNLDPATIAFVEATSMTLASRIMQKGRHTAIKVGGKDIRLTGVPAPLAA